MAKAVFTGFILFLLLAGCGGSRKGIGGDDVANKVKPLKQFDINDVYTSANLIVRARNIADFSYSNKNRFELFVNDKLIRPKNRVDNATPNYNYELKLQPGYYKVNGNYYWHDGWRERKTKVQAKELVRVGQDRQTILDIEIPKDWRGIVTEDDLAFHVSYKSFFEEETVEETVEETPQEVAQPVEAEVEKVRLQINTDPSYCDVIIDDRMVGQTPLSVWVDNSTSHVLQLRKENYRSIMRILEVEELQSNEKIIFIDRLEPLTPFITNAVPRQGSNNNSPLNNNLSSSDTTIQQPAQPVANTEGENNPPSDESNLPAQAQQSVTSDNNSSGSSEGSGEENPPQQAAQPANNAPADTTTSNPGAVSADTTSVAAPN